ncbi:MAG: IclR family transcriptional regulator [Gammaproteobacteria bacterium]|nr:IclR family transcriptional regulator [Gammaproteobacteria bacterium]
MGSTTKSFQLIQAVIDTGSSGATFSEAVRASSVPKSTAHRLLNELIDIGVLRYDSESKTYFGGLQLARLGSAVAAGYDLRKIARPHLESLNERTGHTATLGIRDSDHGIYLDKVESRNSGIRLHSEVGKAFPLHCTGIGKVLLSLVPADELRQALRGKLESFTNRTITDKTLLRSELKQIREQGYAIDDEEITRGMVCVAAPVFDPNGNIAGALSCTFPTWIRDEHGIENEIAAVRHAASSASRMT